MWLALHTYVSSLPRDSSETFRLSRQTSCFEVPLASKWWWQSGLISHKDSQLHNIPINNLKKFFTLSRNSKRRMCRFIYLFFRCDIVGAACTLIYLIHTQRKKTKTKKKAGNFNRSECLGSSHIGYGLNCKTGHFKSWLVIVGRERVRNVEK